MVDARAVADTYWAGVFACGVDEVWADGVHLTFAGDGWGGVYVMRVGEGVRIRASTGRRPLVEAATGGRTPHELTRPEHWRDALGALSPVVLGPASHFLADAAPAGAAPTRRIGRPELEAFAADQDPAELEESGILGGAEAFGVDVDGRLAAVASLAPWAGANTDVGVLTGRDVRARGAGTAVAAAAVGSATGSAGFARWRCRDDNSASLALARRLGLTFYGTNLGIRL